MKNNILSTLALAGAICLSSAMAEAATISGVLAEIGRNNISLKAALADVEAASLELGSENALPATSFEFSPFFQKGVSGLSSTEIIASQEFEFPSIYAQRSKANAAEAEANARELDTQKKTIMLEAKQLCLDLILIRNKKDILTARLDAAGKLLTALEKKGELGVTTRLEINKVKLDIEEIQRELIQNEMAAEETEDALIALNSDKELDLEGLEYEVDPARYVIPTNPEELVAVDSRMTAAEARTNAARHQVVLSKNEWLPTLNLGYRRNADPEVAQHGMLVGASFPLFSAGKKVKAAKARLAAAQMQAESTAAEVRASKESELKQLKMSANLLATYNLDLIRETMALYDKSLEESTISLPDYYAETSILYDRLLTRAELENTWQKQLALLLANSL